MIALLLFLIFLFLIGKFIVGAAFSAAGALIGLLIVVIIYFAKRKRSK